MRRLDVKSCSVDGDAIVANDDGLSASELLRYRRQDHAVTLCALDLIEVDGWTRGGTQSRNRKNICHALRSTVTMA
jgi:ATP-dependent DNA ligase